MSYKFQKTYLPATELGDERCLQIGYFGHGDIFVATWSGPIIHEPRREDGISTCFNLAHGGDLLMLASCVGYLRKIGRPEEEIKATILRAGRRVINDDLGDMRFHSSGSESLVESIVGGESLSRYDRDGLVCLMPPRTAQPGVLEQTRGTGIYMRPNPDGEDTLVYTCHRPTKDKDGTRIDEVADFCPEDIPFMARLICEMSQGEYRMDLRKFIGTDFLDEPYDRFG